MMSCRLLSVARLGQSVLLSLGLLLGSVAHAWDATGHRLSAYVVWEILALERRAELLTLLESHPRYQQDFVEQMPLTVLVGSDEEKLRWTLGQAAVWPDVARGLSEEERPRTFIHLSKET